ncbi:MAG TPA: serine hydrolase domain-containing protein [Hanamia sp.]|nr:serine hydrolase domain-containing protein [Hanamia sp.]
MQKKIIAPGFLFFLLMPVILSAQVIATKGKPDPSVNYQRLKKIDDVINNYINKKWLTGMVTIVVKDNQIIQYKGYGYSDYESKKLMDSNAIFRIASQTKAITSAGILILYEQGKLRLDQNISDFIPSFKNPVVLDQYNAADTTYTTVPAKREITFRDLLTQSSGIDYAEIGSDKMKAIYAKSGIPSGLGDINESLLDRISILGKLPLSFSPGERWQYGLNTDVLGCLIEVISRQNLQDFLTENIFEPLGMNDTYFNVPASKANRLTSVYTEDSLHQIIKWDKDYRGIFPDYPLAKKTYFSGGAGLSCTAFDYAIFLQMLLNGGKYNGHQILSRRTVEIMTSPQLDFLFNGVDNFSLGFDITSEKSANRNSRNEGSFAWGGYFGTTYWADPKEKLIVLIMTQQTPNTHYELSGILETMIYAALK